MSTPEATAAYQLRARERPRTTWLWALAQNLPVVGLAPQLYYAFSRRTLTPMIGASVGLLVGLGIAGLGYGALGHPSASLECLAFLDPSAPPDQLERQVRDCLRRSLPDRLDGSVLEWSMAGLITATAVLGTHVGQTQAITDARRRLAAHGLLPAALGQSPKA
ncbi:hypothetical protein [Cyanobium sp. Morenito 9A2]|uniref:hypothetical protein n=1 Tax=Cyanobium sp. Morenito 9A2 TaxID=2823718 RepID=UPI0020CE4D48|nr:hypothetical protein [Cyanobium sp. Morenito 9A2]MCP9848822.1 hypothetical protein [Cyanobium sp. Morenito 9A2]